jgi:hypothetical protein
VVDPTRIIGKNGGPRRRGTRGCWPPPPKKKTYVRAGTRLPMQTSTTLQKLYVSKCSTYACTCLKH